MILALLIENCCCPVNAGLFLPDGLNYLTKIFCVTDILPVFDVLCFEIVG